MNRSSRIEFLTVSVLALCLFLPFLAIQYDPNGLVEAMSIENGSLLNKNHMLYRPLGLLVWRAFQFAGYSGRSLIVLQGINAIAGTVGIGFAYLAFARMASSRRGALLGTLFLATSFTYWVSSTDVFYIAVAGMFAAGALACIAHARSARWVVAAGVLAAFSVFTWQGSLFLVPALLFAFPKKLRRLRYAAVFSCTAGFLTAAVYVTVAVASRGFMGPQELWTWFTHYSETATLPIWGSWGIERIPTAAVSALDSITAVRLAAGFHDLFRHVQLGRIAVDFSVLAFTALAILAGAKARSNTLALIAAYLCFFPFIVWWDPGSHKWFLVPNIFLAAFLVQGLTPWLQRKYMAIAILFCVLVIAGTNFWTTIRPRHFDLGSDRQMAQCVAEHMRAEDLFVAAEWGWPDYLRYLHNRTAINMINESARFKNTKDIVLAVLEIIDDARKQRGTVYMADPRSYREAHLEWLKAATGLTLQDLTGFGGTPSFVCYGVTMNRID